jgi:vitamin B12 transporter
MASRRFFLAFAVVFSGLAGSASSLAAGSADLVPVEEQIVVTATRTPTPLEDVLSPVIVIDRAAIERSGAGDPGDLLRFHAGLDLARNGGPGQTTAVFIRGADSNHTLVLVDGVRINPGTIGLAALQSIAPSSIERIEVVKGPRSALYGTEAIGGVINVITRRGSRQGWTAEVGYGDYDSREASLNGGLAFGRAELDLGVAWMESDGFPTRTEDRTDRGFDNLNTTAQLRTEIGSSEVAVRYWRAAGTTEYSDFFLTPVDQDFVTSTTSLQVAIPVRDSLRATVTASHLDDSTEQNQSRDFLRTRRDALDAQFDWDLSPAQALSAGGMFNRERASSASYGEAMQADTDTLSLYVQDRVESGPQRVLAALGYTNHETAGEAFTWNAEYGYELGGTTLLYALAGTGFRAPDATDRYGFGGNPDLEPERSLNLEAGVRHRINGRHSVSLSAFRNDIDDLIEFVTLSYDPFAGEMRNVDRARIEGVEAAYEFAGGPWRARVEAIYQDPENLTTGEQLYRRARESLTVSIARSLGRFEFGLDVLATGDRKDFGFPEPVTLAGYVLANVTARWQATRSLAVVARLENALNEQYELAHTFNTPDRGLYVSLSYSPVAQSGTLSLAQVDGQGGSAARGAYSPASRISRVAR